MKKESTIHIDIALDEEKVPEKITWSASDSTAPGANDARAMMVSFWDAGDKNAMRIDLWTKKMMVDEMADFMYQTMMGMADTFLRATKDDALSGEMKQFARSFMEAFKKKQQPASGG